MAVSAWGGGRCDFWNIPRILEIIALLFVGGLDAAPGGCSGCGYWLVIVARLAGGGLVVFVILVRLPWGFFLRRTCWVGESAIGRVYFSGGERWMLAFDWGGGKFQMLCVGTKGSLSKVRYWLCAHRSKSRTNRPLHLNRPHNIYSTHNPLPRCHSSRL